MIDSLRFLPTVHCIESTVKLMSLCRHYQLYTDVFRLGYYYEEIFYFHFWTMLSDSLFVSWWVRGKILFQWERRSYVMNIAAICIIFFFFKFSFDIVNETLVQFVPCFIVVRESYREIIPRVVGQLKGF